MSETKNNLISYDSNNPITSNKHIIFAFTFNKDGSSFHINNKSIGAELKNENLAWVHLDANNSKTSLWLKKEVSYLDQIIVDALLADETRPRLNEFNDGILLVLRGVNLDQNSSPEDMVSIRMWIDSHRIITIQKRPTKAVQDIAKNLKDNIGPKNAGEFLADLCYNLSDHLEPFIDNLTEIIDSVEDKILEENFDSDSREDVAKVRKQAIIFKRHISPQKEVINRLRNINKSWLIDNHKRHIQENYENICRYVEDLDEIKERSQVLYEEIASETRGKLEKNMYILSVLAAIFMPLTFITGLFGMNLINIPLSENDKGFWIIISSLVILVGLQIIWSKFKKWF